MDDYLDGIYWICLRNARPEVMIDDRARWEYASRERYITSIKQRCAEAFDTSTA